MSAMQDEQSPLLKILRLEAPAIDLIQAGDTDRPRRADRPWSHRRCDRRLLDPPSRFRTSLLFEYDDVLIVGGKRKLAGSTTRPWRACRWSLSPFGGGAGGRHRRLHLRARSRQAVGNVRPRGPRTGIVRKRPAAAHSCFAAAFPGPARPARGLELAAIVPRPLARAFERAHAVTIYELPHATTPVEVRLLWHERIEGEPAHDWPSRCPPARDRGAQAGAVASSAAPDREARVAFPLRPSRRTSRRPWPGRSWCPAPDMCRGRSRMNRSRRRRDRIEPCRRETIRVRRIGA